VETVTQQFLRDLEFDAKLLALLESGLEAPEPKDENEIVPTRDELAAKRLDVPVQQVWGGMMRLRRRRLFR